MKNLNNVTKSANNYTYYRCMSSTAYKWSAAAAVAHTFCAAQSIKSLHRAIHKIALTFNHSKNDPKIPVSQMPGASQPMMSAAAGNYKKECLRATSS